MSVMNAPLVSVIITCYNYAEYVDAAISSVLRQTYENLELIVIDDGSTDDSREIINRYQDKALIISRANKGIVYSRNEGLRLAKGEYVCFLDADDYFNDDYILKSMRVMAESGADVVYPNWHVVGENEYYTDFADFDVQKLITQEIHCTVESLIRKSAIRKHQYESERVAEDWDFFVGMALDGKKFQLAKDNYINYRVRKNTRGSARPYWEDMYIFCELLTKWQSRFPGLVNPFDLPIAVGKRRDEFIEEQKKIIDKQTNEIEAKNIEIEHQSLDLSSLREQLKSIENSKTYAFSASLSKQLSLPKALYKKITLPKK
jgi:glucosyltransferase